MVSSALICKETKGRVGAWLPSGQSVLGWCEAGPRRAWEGQVRLDEALVWAQGAACRETHPGELVGRLHRSDLGPGWIWWTWGEH